MKISLLNNNLSSKHNYKSKKLLNSSISFVSNENEPRFMPPKIEALRALYATNIIQKITSKKAMDKYVPGYHIQKEHLRKNIVEPLMEPKIATTKKVPPVICLYGPDVSLKTDLLKGIAKEANCKVSMIEADTDTFGEDLRDVISKAGDDFDATGKKTILIIRKPEKALSASFENRHNVDDLLFAVENQYFYKYGGENIIFALATEDISLISANIEKQVEMYVPVPVVDNKNLIDIISELLAKQNSEYADIALDDKEIGEIALILMPNSDGAYNLNQIKQIVTRSYKNSVETSTKISDNVLKIANATQRYISKAQIDAYEKKVSATF